MYKSASAFAPICNPVSCPWGEKAFTGYLGADKSLWAAHDATELVKSYDGPDLHLLIDQGSLSLSLSLSLSFSALFVSLCRSLLARCVSLVTV
eukprot:COSAG03_NODE_1004_length_5053_cov_3.080743_2_plen_93_part_00